MTSTSATTARTFTIICPGRKDRVTTDRAVAMATARQLAAETGEKVRITGGVWRR